jgi:pyruvate dehydrogenase E2 component (dihydrolipoamide acetyltransferase)
MPTAVIMPKFEMAQETGTVGRWLVQEGETVAKGDIILEVETDKVTMDVEATAAGRLAGICAAPGGVVPIGQTIAYILKPGEALPQRPGEQPAPSRNGAPVTPVAARVAAAHGLDLAALPGRGPHGRVTRSDVEAHLAAQAHSRTASLRDETQADGKVKAVPAARRLSRELGVDLGAVAGSGPGGRIQSEDVRRAAAERETAGRQHGGAAAYATTEVAAPLFEPAPAVPAPSAGPAAGRRVPLSSVRRTIAERMTTSVTTIPQFTVSVDVEMSRAVALVEEVRSAAISPMDLPKVTLTALLVKACAWTLQRRPEANASFEGDHIVEWNEINVGVATAAGQGLVVPVIRSADRLGLYEIAQQLLDLGARARAGRLRLQDVQGGTFTISNLGMFGIDHFTAIINPPQSAILAVGRVAQRAVVLDDGSIVVRPLATLTMTADHRVLDGAAATQWLKTLQNVLEHPGLLLA